MNEWSKNRWVHYWNRLADSRDELLSGDWTHVSKEIYSKRIHYIADLLRLTPHDTLVDIGCGKGLFLRFCHTDFSCYAGLDFAFKQLVTNHNMMIPHSHYRVFINGKADCLPFKSSSIRKLLINSVTHYLEETALKKMLRELNRVLHPDGICLLGDVQSDKALTKNNTKNSSHSLYYTVKFYLKKIPILVWINSTFNQRMLDIKRGFHIDRHKTNTYEISQIMEWIMDVNKNLRVQVSFQNECAFYPNRYDILIRKSIDCL